MYFKKEHNGCLSFKLLNEWTNNPSNVKNKNIQIIEPTGWSDVECDQLYTVTVTGINDFIIGIIYLYLVKTKSVM